MIEPSIQQAPIPCLGSVFNGVISTRSSGAFGNIVGPADDDSVPTQDLSEDKCGSCSDATGDKDRGSDDPTATETAPTKLMFIVCVIACW